MAGLSSPNCIHGKLRREYVCVVGSAWRCITKMLLQQVLVLHRFTNEKFEKFLLAKTGGDINQQRHFNNKECGANKNTENAYTYIYKHAQNSNYKCIYVCSIYMYVC